MNVLYFNAILFSFTFLLLCKQSVSKNPTDLKDLLNELSWSVKLKVWNDFMDTNVTETTTKATGEPAQKTPYAPVHTRRASMSSLIKPSRRQHDLNPMFIDTPEEANMRMKLFRLMYETIRDSDLKVKRAELIREHYVNSTTFQIGYLFGDLTDKYSTIMDISNTLQRFYKEWNSIEHINAYEQIANQAIEISHLIDMVRVMNKRDQ